MLDPAYIREHLDEVKANCRNRNVQADPDRVVALDDERKRLIAEAQALQQRHNELSKLLPGRRTRPARRSWSPRARASRGR